MSYASVDDGKTWYALRQSKTTFLSAETAIGPECVRLVFPHNERKVAK